MASDLELVKSELAFHGIRVMDNGQCSSYREGSSETTHSSCDEMISSIQKEVDENKLLLQKYWTSMRQSLLQSNSSLVGGTSTTEKMFAAALKHFLKFSKKYKHFQGDAKLIRQALSKDVKSFSEISMSKIVDYKICIDWLDHLVRQDLFCCSMLKYFDKHRMENKAVTAQQLVPSGIFDMEGDEQDPLKERRWKWEDNDFKDDTRPPNMEAVMGKDPEWLDEGFYWWEPRNEPYLYGDEENDPYANTHYYNFKSKVHNGVDK